MNILTKNKNKTKNEQKQEKEKFECIKLLVALFSIFLTLY